VKERDGDRGGEKGGKKKGKKERGERTELLQKAEAYHLDVKRVIRRREGKGKKADADKGVEGPISFSIGQGGGRGGGGNQCALLNFGGKKEGMQYFVLLFLGGGEMDEKGSAVSAGGGNPFCMKRTCSKRGRCRQIGPLEKVKEKGGEEKVLLRPFEGIPDSGRCGGKKKGQIEEGKGEFLAFIPFHTSPGEKKKIRFTEELYPRGKKRREEFFSGGLAGGEGAGTAFSGGERIGGQLR